MPRSPQLATIVGILTTFLLSSSVVDAFSFTIPQLNPANPAVKELSKAQDSVLLNIRLDVGEKEDSHLLLDGLVIELQKDAAPKGHVSLPGSSGPNPHLSGGASSLKILDDARFIGTSGVKTVDLQDGCWELVWREDAPAGTVVCGFDLSDDVTRGDAVLPKGRIYVSLPVWNRAGLTKQQTYKAKKLKEAEQHKIDQDDEIAKMQETSNPLMKALHYRNAVAATEKLSMSGVNTFLTSIPSDDEVMPINNDLLLCTKGTVWTKTGSFLGKEHLLLGVANASPESLDQTP